MRTVNGMDFIGATNEERLPDYGYEFPYAATHVMLGRYPEQNVPWHWHNAAELFYISEGEVTYITAGGSVKFPQGSAGIVMPNALHRSEWDKRAANVQKIHFFDVSLLFGPSVERMSRKYIMPLVSDPRNELLELRPDDLSDKAVIEKTVDAFGLDSGDFLYEKKLRDALCEIWMYLLTEKSGRQGGEVSAEGNGLVKQMLVFIASNCEHDININDISAAAHIGVRTCYRLFDKYIHITPNEYLRSCRVDRACALLRDTDKPVTEIAAASGFSSVSYFSKVLQDRCGCSATEYRRNARAHMAEEDRH